MNITYLIWFFGPIVLGLHSFTGWNFWIFAFNGGLTFLLITYLFSIGAMKMLPAVQQAKLYHAQAAEMMSWWKAAVSFVYYGLTASYLILNGLMLTFGYAMLVYIFGTAMMYRVLTLKMMEEA